MTVSTGRTQKARILTAEEKKALAERPSLAYEHLLRIEALKVAHEVMPEADVYDLQRLAEYILNGESDDE